GPGEGAGAVRVGSGGTRRLVGSRQTRRSVLIHRPPRRIAPSARTGGRSGGNMNTRILVSAVAIGLAAVSGTALADNGRHKGHDRDRGRDGDYARVVRVEPMVERVRY